LPWDGVHVPTIDVNLRLLVTAACISIHQSGYGVVVTSGAANSSAPPGQPYFGNVGYVGGGSAIYLGNRWVMTAAHVAGSLPASATFGGNLYATQAGTFNRLHKPDAFGNPTLTVTDAVVFRLAADPGLPWMTLASSTPTVSASVMMIGSGRQQLGTPTYWNVDVLAGPNNDIWTELGSEIGAEAAGFKTSGTRITKWGENQITSTGIELDYGAGPVSLFTTTFNGGAMTHEAQGVVGDSGGAVFINPGSGWQLAGMMSTVGLFENQPGGAETAVLGNLTYSADISAYRNEILSYTAIPEPETAAFCLLAGGVLLHHRRRKQCMLNPALPAQESTAGRQVC
jgi:hypothetical protein